MAICLGVVSDEVLGRRPHSHALHTADVGDRHARGQQRIFREAFEATSAERGADDVHRRREDDVDALGACFLTELCGQPLDQAHVPRRGEGDRRRQRGRRVRRIEPNSAHAGGAIGNDDRPQADSRLGMKGPAVSTGEKADLLLERQPRDQA